MRKSVSSQLRYEIDHYVIDDQPLVAQIPKKAAVVRENIVDIDVNARNITIDLTQEPVSIEKTAGPYLVPQGKKVEKDYKNFSP